MVNLEVEGKFPGREFPPRIISIEASRTVGEFMCLLGLGQCSTELIIVYNGESVTMDDRLECDGNVVILPVVCGG